MPGPCEAIPVPGGIAACKGAGKAISAGAGAAGGSFLQQAADALAKGFAKVVAEITTWWTNVPTPTLSQTSGPVADLRTHLAWIVAAVGVGSLMIAMGRLAVSPDVRAGREAAWGLTRLVLVSATAVPAVGLLTTAGDRFSQWIIDQAAGGDMGRALAQLTALTPLRALGTMVLLIVALVGLLAGVVQLGLMGVRAALLVVLAGTIPIAAAASTTERGRQALDRMLTWLLAFAVYKPVAAVIYAAAFWVVGSGKGQTGAITAMAGLAMLVLAIIALPAFMKLIAPGVERVTGSASSGGSGAIAGAAGAALGSGAVSSGGSSGGGLRGQPPAGGGGGSGPGLVDPPGAGASGGGSSGAAQPAGPGSSGGSRTASSGSRAGSAAAGAAGAAAAGASTAKEIGQRTTRGVRRQVEDSAGDGPEGAR